MSRSGREPPTLRLQASTLPKELFRQLIRWLFGTSTALQYASEVGHKCLGHYASEVGKKFLGITL